VKRETLIVGAAATVFLVSLGIRLSGQTAGTATKPPATSAATRQAGTPARTGAAPARTARPTVSHSQPPTQAEFKAVIKDLFDLTCSECHNPVQFEGGFDVGQYYSVDTLASDRDQWERILAKLKAREMPPPEIERPEEQIDTLVKFLDK